ncbi:MAG: hypothetical protein ABIY52_18570 [Gemmatimonadaceae bacterium]
MTESSGSSTLRNVLVAIALLVVAATVRSHRHRVAVAAAARATHDSLAVLAGSAEAAQALTTAPAPAAKTGPGWDEVRQHQAQPQADPGLVQSSAQDRDDRAFAAASGQGLTTKATYVAPRDTLPPPRSRP